MIVFSLLAVEKENCNEHDSVITESSIKDEPNVCEADANKEDNVLITESCTGDESGSREPDLNPEPHEGMLFESVQAAKAFYDDYARRVGFVIRIISSRKSERDGELIHQRLACNREGFNVNRQKNGSVWVRKRESIREGCMAKLNVRRDEPGRWVITKFVKEHNHPLLITSGNGLSDPAEKDKKIQELSSELDHANQELEACREQLHAFMASIEEHKDHLSKTIEDSVQNIKEVESRNRSHHL